MHRTHPTRRTATRPATAKRRTPVPNARLADCVKGFVDGAVGKAVAPHTTFRRALSKIQNMRRPILDRYVKVERASGIPQFSFIGTACYRDGIDTNIETAWMANLALCYEGLDKPEKAAQCVERLIDIHPRFSFDWLAGYYAMRPPEDRRMLENTRALHERLLWRRRLGLARINVVDLPPGAGIGRREIENIRQQTTQPGYEGKEVMASR